MTHNEIARARARSYASSLISRVMRGKMPECQFTGLMEAFLEQPAYSLIKQGLLADCGEHKRRVLSCEPRFKRLDGMSVLPTTGDQFDRPFIRKQETTHDHT